MKVTNKSLPGQKIELAIELEPQDFLPWMRKAAVRLSEQAKIPGFRPGKAPYDLVKKHVSEEVIFREALEDIVNASLHEALVSEKIKTYGQPAIDLKQADPAGIVSYTAVFSVLPEVKLGDWESTKLKRQEVAVSPEELDKALDELAGMLMSETAVDRPAAQGDKVVLDFDVLVDGVPIEGGSAKEYGVVLGEGKMIPGFEDQMLGKQAGAEFDFKLNFPADYKAGLAGKEAEFKIKIHSVLRRSKPEINDEFAKRLGATDKQDLTDKLSENLLKDKTEKEEQRAEIAAVKQVVAAASISELPKALVDDEAHKILHEFEHDLSHQGMDLQSYLKNAGKTHDDVKKEFRPRAEERIKTSLVLDELIEQHKITVTPEEVTQELNQQKEYNKDRKQVLEDINRPDYAGYLYNRLLNRKVIKLITDKIVE